MEINLTAEETNKLNNLWRTAQFARSWRAVKNTVKELKIILFEILFCYFFALL